MSRKVSDDKYKKTLSHKLETWFYGSEDVYVNHVEMKPQHEFLESEEEEKALIFFKKHISENTRFYNLFYEDHLDEEKGATFYSKASHIKDTIDMDMKFVDFDMFGESKVKGKYDIVLVSNILEWARGDKSKFMIAKENLSSILNKDGLVVCSNLVDRSKSTILSEREIFDSNFECSEFTTGYIYRKK